MLRRILGKQLKHEEPENKNPHFLYPCLLLDLMKPFFNHWSPLTQASHYMTTSRPAGAIQTGTRVSPANVPKVFYDGCPCCRNPPYFWVWGQWLLFKSCWIAWGQVLFQCHVMASMLWQPLYFSRILQILNCYTAQTKSTSLQSPAITYIHLFRCHPLLLFTYRQD